MFEWVSSLLPETWVPFLTAWTESRLVLVLLLTAGALWIWGRQPSLRFALVLGLIGLLLMDFWVDQLKPLVGRIKPYQSLTFVPAEHVAFSFPSSHAANFSFAWMYFRKVPLLGPFLLGCMGMFSALRVLCGRHYVLDVVGGGLLGLSWGAFLGFVVAGLSSLKKSKRFFAPEDPETPAAVGPETPATPLKKDA
jgi:membrane-associated phospholipid phosphatase